MVKVSVVGMVIAAVLFQGCSNEVDTCQNHKGTQLSGINDVTYGQVLKEWSDYTGCQNPKWEIIESNGMKKVLYTCQISNNFVKYTEASGHNIQAIDLIDHIDVNLSFGVKEDRCYIDDSRDFDTIVHLKKSIQVGDALGMGSSEQNFINSTMSGNLAYVHNVLIKKK